MTSLQTIADEHAETPFLKLLFVGGSDERLSSLIDGAGKLGCFDRIASVASDLGDLSGVATLGEELRVADFHKCLVIVWDLEPVRSAGRLEDFLDAMPNPGRWSPQVCCIGLADNDFKLSFGTFRKLIAHDFAWLGDARHCLETLRDWCAREPAGLEQGLSVRVPFAKEPSKWILCGNHDYRNATFPHKLKIEEAGLCKAQRRIAFWQYALRNVLLASGETLSARPTPAKSFEEETEDYQKIYSTPFRLVVPRELAGACESKGWERGEDFDIYTSRDSATDSLKELVGKGIACGLVHDPADDLPEIPPGAGAARHVPILLVGEPEQERTWSSWPGELTHGRLASYPRSEFLSEGFRLDIKRGHWRPFCLLTLAEAFDLTINLMMQTYYALRGEDGKGSDIANLRRVFYCIAQVSAARVLYVGPSEGRSADRPLHSSTG